MFTCLCILGYSPFIVLSFVIHVHLTLFAHSFLFFLSILSSTPFSTITVAYSYTSCPPSLYVCAWCPAASESVLLQQLFQSKLTQTGSLVPAAQGHIGLRGTKAALLFQKMPSASSVNATSVPQQPRRYHDLTKVKHVIHTERSCG